MLTARHKVIRQMQQSKITLQHEAKTKQYKQQEMKSNVLKAYINSAKSTVH